MIPKADRDADAAILAAATRGTWITVHPSSQEGGVQLAGFGPALAPRWSTATSIRVGGTDSNTAERAADVAVAAAQMTMEQHAANAKAAAHAVNRLPEYIADAAEMERRIRLIEAKAEEWRTKAIALHAAGEHAVSDLARARLDSLTGAVRILRGGK